MNNDSNRMQNDLRSMMSILSPDISQDVIESRLEEILYRYDIQHKAMQELENDMQIKTDLFLSSKMLEGLSGKTLKDYRMELRLFQRHTNKAVVQIQTPDIRSYLASLQNVQSSTVGKKLTVLKSFFGWLVKEEMLLRDPTAKVRLPKKKKRLPKGLTVAELELIREMCVNKRERALVEVFYSTGCRLSELASMDIDSIDKQDMSTTVIGKGDKERKVYLTHKALFHLDKYLNTRHDNCGALFVTVRKPHRRMSNGTIQDEIEKISKRANLKRDFTPHTFRHTLAQNMLDNGASLEEVQHILGHENIGTTQIYTHVSEERKQTSHRRYA
ncbi:tyrosine-type recombinase/integrase [Planococcus kocurii]|uniref:tyrosine-type recombinase/integrase n=1 Tax=Planococcus kocurii TaxID=1374 RepID=UPI003D002882